MAVTHAFASFNQQFPGYAATRALDDVRRRDFSRLDRLGHVYLDFTGSGLYAESQVQRHADLLVASVFGNPHSINPTSRASTEGVEHARQRVLDYFGADTGEYTVVFAANASQALKLVGEAFLSRTDITTCLNRDPIGMSYDEFRSCIDPKAAGAVRASLGLASNFSDAWRLVDFVKGFVEG